MPQKTNEKTAFPNLSKFEAHRDQEVSKNTKTVARNVERDPKFDNTKLTFGTPDGKVPYKPRHTYRGEKGQYCSAQEYREATKDLTQMQKHIAWFDGDCDGVIWMQDTFMAFYKLNFGIILSLLAMFIIHGPFSYPTIPKKGDRWSHYLPDPFMRIWVANINKCKHGSDSESYRRTGEFNEERFDNLFESYSSKPERDGLSFHDMMMIIYERRNIMDFFGVFAMMFELGSSYMLLWPADGYCRKEELLGIYDGSVFPAIAQNRSKKGAFRRKIEL